MGTAISLYPRAGINHFASLTDGSVSFEETSGKVSFNSLPFTSHSLGIDGVIEAIKFLKNSSLSLLIMGNRSPDRKSVTDHTIGCYRRVIWMKTPISTAIELVYDNSGLNVSQSCFTLVHKTEKVWTFLIEMNDEGIPKEGELPDLTSESSPEMVEVLIAGEYFILSKLAKNVAEYSSVATHTGSVGVLPISCLFSSPNRISFSVVTTDGCRTNCEHIFNNDIVGTA
jgi:hypothetical protein